jgi:hypothetical protein
MSNDVLNAATRNDFQTFFHRCFNTVLPGDRFFYNWHISALAHVLERIRRGELTRVIINLPPRYLKSLIVSVAYPAFLLGHEPHKKIFGISYGNELAAKHAGDFRSIVTSPWYRQAFPHMKTERIADNDVFTTAKGFRRTTSVHSSLTGLGGSVFIIDDPLKAMDAMSDAHRKSLNDWFSNTLVSRLDDKKAGAIIVVMQRVHMNDLTGHLLENSDGWEVLSLPAIAETSEKIPLVGGRFYIRQPGDVLHPEREPRQTLDAIRRELGPDLFAAQYQQCPVPPGGAMIKSNWLRYFDEPPLRTPATKILQSWDTAAKDGAQNAWSVCTTWLIVNRKDYYLLDLTRGRFEYPKLKDTAILLAKRYQPNQILIEDASTGTALAQELKLLLPAGHTYPSRQRQDRTPLCSTGEI